MRPYVMIAVGNLEASRRFWHEAMGLAISGHWPGQVAVRAGALDILLDATGEFTSTPPEIGLPFDRPVLDATLARLASHGIVPFRGPRSFGGPLGHEAAVRDPDGVCVVLYSGPEDGPPVATLGHVGINLSNPATSFPFWKDMLGYLGFTITEDGPHFDASDGRSYLCVNASAPDPAGALFHRRRTGLNHVALRVASRERVDQFCHEFLEPRHIAPLYGGPRAYPEYATGYYAVYFEDPDRIKIEVAHEPAL